MKEENKDLQEDEYIEIDSLKLIEMISKTTDIVQEIFDNFYKKFELSKTQFSALYLIYLSQEEGIALSVLSEKLSVTRSNITSLVDRMVSRGLIERTSSEVDRRSIKAVITREGKEILEKVLPNNSVFSSEILNFLTKKEKERFYELLLKIQKELIDNYLTQ
jgi:MarR family 2-MHQ and catechol resistance regulon transcriptional repressor